MRWVYDFLKRSGRKKGRYSRILQANNVSNPGFGYRERRAHGLPPGSNVTLIGMYDTENNDVSMKDLIVAHNLESERSEERRVWRTLFSFVDDIWCARELFPMIGGP